MFDNKISLTRIEGRRNKNIILFFSVILIIIFAANVSIPAAGSVKTHGILTSVEEDGTVIIDEKGYLLSPTVIVENYKGERISVSGLLPPRLVNFEYMYGVKGFIVIFIKEVPQ